jgi:hypothetical protein
MNILNKNAIKNQKNAKYCAIGNTEGINSSTCFSKKQLIYIIKHYNTEQPGNRIEYTQNMTKEELIKILMEKFKDCSGKEYCILDKDPIKRLKVNENDYTGTSRHFNKCNDGNIEECDSEYNMNKSIYQYTFLPEEAVDSRNINKKYVWLSNIDIVNVMRQYEKEYNDFVFFGPLPVDFAKIMDTILLDVCQGKNTLDKLYSKGIRRIGIILNLDKYGQPGSHWVSIFIDVSQNNINRYQGYGTVEYFDSTSMGPPKNIREYLEHATKRLKKICKQPIKVLINNMPHQMKNSECGIYSIFYILSRLNGNPFEKYGVRKFNQEQKNILNNPIQNNNNNQVSVAGSTIYNQQEYQQLPGSQRINDDTIFLLRCILFRPHELRDYIPTHCVNEYPLIHETGIALLGNIYIKYYYNHIEGILNDKNKGGAIKKSKSNKKNIKGKKNIKRKT